MIVAALIAETANYAIGNTKFPVTGNGGFFKVRYISSGNNETELVIRVNDDGEITSYNDEGINSKVNKPGNSIKTQRTYQLGVVYRDAYGRETPVQTSSDLSVKLNKIDATNYNKIKAKITSLAPEFAKSFKFFIKEPSNEYYNLAMDRLYDAEDGNVWLSFSSADRNKVSEGDFIELKKQHASSEPVREPAKYKIVAISNEAPLYIKEVELSYGVVSLSPSDIDSSGPPLVGNSSLVVNKDVINDSGLKSAATETTLLRYMRIISPSGNSNYYQIISMALMNADDKYKIQIKGKFKDDMEFTSTNNNYSGLINGLSLEIKRKKFENKPEFQGRFFAKIYRDSILNKHLVDPWRASDEEQDNWVVVESRQVRYHNNASDMSKSTWRNAPYGGGSDWKHWFIDRSMGEHGGRGIGYQMGGDRWDLSFSSVFPRGGSFDVGFTSETAGEASFVNLITAPGTKFRWREDPNQEVYTIRSVGYQNVKNYNNSDYGSNKRRRYKITVTSDKLLGTGGFDPRTGNGNYDDDAKTLEIIVPYFEGSEFTTNNPAIWETEPKEDLNLDLYYEASDAYPISEHNDEKELPWYNCVSFANGVESNRIRDDFNAVTIDKGPKVSSILAEQYKEETRPNGFIFSQIYNSTSGLNGFKSIYTSRTNNKRHKP